jgi:hypothetical protein
MAAAVHICKVTIFPKAINDSGGIAAHGDHDIEDLLEMLR